MNATHRVIGLVLIGLLFIAAGIVGLQKQTGFGWVQIGVGLLWLVGAVVRRPRGA